MNGQLFLLLPGTLVQHVGSREIVRVAECQEPIRGIEWLHSPETIYVSRGWQRIPMARTTLQSVEADPS
jgi:hypothetical protein